MRRWLAASLAALSAHADDLAEPLGKQRAAASPLQWQAAEAGHPALGNIRYAFMKDHVETPVGAAKVFSRAYVSCQLASGRIAIELTNATAPDDPGGLRPASPPRLTCNRPAAPAGDTLVQEALLANWQVSEIGDALERGFRPYPLRECVSIGVAQEVQLPPGWARQTARIEFEILPYNRELDSVFAACGERSAYAPVAVAAAAPVAKPPAKAPAPAAAPSRWRAARTVASGHTNVRAKPSLQAATVVQLDPGAPILVQRASGDWWRARPAKGAAFEGYIRGDRLSFK